MKKLIFSISACAFIVMLLVVSYFEIVHHDSIQQRKQEIEQQIIAEKLAQEKKEKKIEKYDTNGEYFYAICDRESYNNELQHYLSGQVKIKKNNIRFTADYISNRYLSGKVITKKPVRYGRFSFRVSRSITKKGMFPAIWMLPENGDRYPEIDIYEMIGSEPQNLYCTLHSLNGEDVEVSSFKHLLNSSQMNDGYVLTFEWSKNSMDWYIDGKHIGSITENVPDVEMHLIINLAIGGDWPGNPDNDAFPEIFDIEVLEYSPVDEY